MVKGIDHEDVQYNILNEENKLNKYLESIRIQANYGPLLS